MWSAACDGRIQFFSLSIWPSVFVWAERGIWTNARHEPWARSLAGICRTISFNEYFFFHWNYRSQHNWCKKIGRKKESEVRYMVSISNRDYAGRGDLDQGRFGKRALFKRRLRLLRLKADTSRLKTCWYCANSVKNASLFCWERNAKFHKNPKNAEIIIRRRSILAQQLEREFFFIFK